MLLVSLLGAFAHYLVTNDGGNVDKVNGITTVIMFSVTLSHAKLSIKDLAVKLIRGGGDLK